MSHEMIDERRHFPQMEGRFVFKHAVRRMPEVLLETLNAASLKLEDVDLFLFHQANLRINEFVMEQMGIPAERCSNNIQRYGNCSSASIPILLDEAARAGRLEPGQVVSMTELRIRLFLGERCPALVVEMPHCVLRHPAPVGRIPIKLPVYIDFFSYPNTLDAITHRVIFVFTPIFRATRAGRATQKDTPMAEHETLSEATESRINEAVQFVDDEFQRVQKELSARRKSLEKEFASKRKTVEKRTRKELKRIQSELKKNPIVKRADAVRKDVTKQVETRVDSLLGLMQVASRSDVQRINKKLTTLNRRLKAIEESRKTNGSSPSI